MLATTMQQITAQLGSTSRRQIMHAAEARQPMRVWPSPPMFQNRMRKAGVTAREMHSSMATFWRVTHMRRGDPKVPLKMVT